MLGVDSGVTTGLSERSGETIPSPDSTEEDVIRLSGSPTKRKVGKDGIGGGGESETSTWEVLGLDFALRTPNQEDRGGNSWDTWRVRDSKE